MLFLTIIGVISVAQLILVTGESHGEFGPIEVKAKVGYLYKKYEQSEDDIRATETVRDVIKYSKRFKHTGIGSVPPFDPYTKAKLQDVQLNSSMINGTLHLSNLKVKNLGEATLQNFQMYAAPSRVDFDISVPLIVVKVHVDGLNIDTGCISFNISTDLTLALHKYQLAGVISIMPNPVLNKYQATGLETTALIEDVEYDTTTTVNCLPIPISMEILKGIQQSINAVIYEDLNGLLLGFTIQQMQRLLQPTQYFVNF